MKWYLAKGTVITKLAQKSCKLAFYIWEEKNKKEKEKKPALTQLFT